MSSSSSILRRAVTALGLSTSLLLSLPALADGVLNGSKSLTSAASSPTNADITYTVQYTCSGTINADKCYDARVVDHLPTNVRVSELPPIAGSLKKICVGTSPDRATCSNVTDPASIPAGSGVTFFLDDSSNALDNGSAGALNLKVYFDPTVTPAGDIATNSVDYQWKPTPTGTQQSNTSSAPPVTATAADKVTINKTVSLNGAAGYQSRYQIEVCRYPSGGDSGWLEPTNVSLTDTLPAGASSVSANPAFSSQSGSTLTWSTITIPAGQRCTTVEVRATFSSSDQGQSKTNQASVTYTPNGQATAVTKNTSVSHTLAGPNPGMGGAKSQSDDVGNPGQSLNWTLRCRNTGNLPLNQCVVTDPLPPEHNLTSINTNGGNLEYWSVANGTSSCVSATYTNHGAAYSGAASGLVTAGSHICQVRVTWNAPAYEILPGSNRAVALEGTVCGASGIVCDSGVTLTLPYNVVNTASFQGQAADGTTLTRTDTTTFQTRDAASNPTIAPVASKKASSASIAPGNPLTFTLSMRNDPSYSSPPEQVDILNPVFADLLPAEVELNPLPPNTAAIAATGTAPASCQQAPTIRVVDNYNSSGRTMVVFDWTGTGCLMKRSEGPRQFTIATRVKAGTPPTATVRNRVSFLGSGNGQNPVTSSERCQAPTTDNPLQTSTSGNFSTGVGVTGKVCQTTNDQSAGFAVASFADVKSRKGVKGQLDSAFGYNNQDYIGRTVPGGAVTWQLEITNSGNVPLEAIDLIDMLPFADADGGTSGRNRGVGTNVPAFDGSTWSPRFVDGLRPVMTLSPSGTQVTGDVFYTNAPNPCRTGVGTDPRILASLPNAAGAGACNPMTLLAAGTPLSDPAHPPAAGAAGQWSPVLPANPANVTAFRIRLNPATTQIPVGQSLSIEFMMQAPFDAPESGCTGGAGQGAACHDVAWNSFGFQYKETGSNVLNGAAPSSVGVIVNQPRPQTASYGNYVWYDTNKDGIQNEPPGNGINNVLVELWFDDGSGTPRLIAAQRTTNNPEEGPEKGRPGYYLFQDLPPTTGNQRYFTSFYAPDRVLDSSTQSAWVATRPDAGSDDAKDSDGKPTAGSHSTAGAPDGGINMEQQGYVQSDPVPLTAGQNYRDADQGFYEKAPKLSLGNRLWFDANNDGIDNDGSGGALGSSTGIGGVTVQLWSADGSTLLKTTTTNGEGYYLFTELDPGSYRVVVPAASFGSGQPLNGYFSSGTQLDGSGNPLNENGMVGTTPAAGQVSSASGLDASDHGLRISTAIGSIPAGSVVSTSVDLQVPAPVNELNSNTDTSKNAPRGKTWGIDDPATDDHSNLTIDFGFFSPAAASISGYVYHDANNDGVKDPGEAAIPGVTITLTGSNGESHTTTTDVNGYYEFKGLRPGVQYTVTEIQPPAPWIDGKDTAGSVFTNTGGSANDRFVVTPAAGEHGQNWNFGELTDAAATASISGYVYHDANNNGVKDPGEAAIAGTTVTLTGSNGETRTVQTDAYGYYQFTGLTPGVTYTVIETQPSGWIDGKDTAGTVFTDAGGGANDRFVVTPGANEHGQNWNFGERRAEPAISPIPTMSQWSLMALSMLLAAVALRRRGWGRVAGHE